jgi:Zn-dependent protease with chaperone function
VDAVLAHELGHFRLKHIAKRIVVTYVLSFLAFALLGWLSTRAWFFTGLGVRPNMEGPNDALALLLFMLALPVFTFFVSPVMAQFSRKHEFERRLRATQTSGEHLGSALLKLYEDNASTLTPDPVFVKFYYSHPPASERLARLHTCRCRGMSGSMLKKRDASALRRRALTAHEIVRRLADLPGGSSVATVTTWRSSGRTPSPTTSRRSPS